MSKNIVECVHWDPEVDAAEQDSRKQNLFWIIIAASAVVIVLALSSLFFFWPSGEQPEDPSGETTLSGQSDTTNPHEQPTAQTPPDENDPDVLLGMSLYQQQNYSGAIAAFTLAIDANREAASANAYMYRGQCYFNQGDYDKAVVDFYQALRRDPNNPQPLIMRGGANYLLNRYPEAISDLTDALKMNLPPESARSAYTYRAHAYEAMGEFALAQADYTSATQVQ